MSKLSNSSDHIQAANTAHPMCYHLVDGHVSGQVDADAAPYVLPLRGLPVIALTRVDGGVRDARAFSKQCLFQSHFCPNFSLVFARMTLIHNLLHTYFPNNPNCDQPTSG